MCSPGRARLGNSQSSSRRPRKVSQAESASRVGSVISNGTGRPVFCLMTVTRWRTDPPGATSLTRSLTKSHPRSLASMPQSKRAAHGAGALQLLPYRPDMLRFEGSLGAHDPARIPGGWWRAEKVALGHRCLRGYAPAVATYRFRLPL